MRFSLKADDALISGHIQSVEYNPSDVDAVDKEKLRERKFQATNQAQISLLCIEIVQLFLKSGFERTPRRHKRIAEGLVIVASGVLVVSRKGFADYVKRHGGKISTSITKSTSFLVNDHGTVGP